MDDVLLLENPRRRRRMPPRTKSGRFRKRRSSGRKRRRRRRNPSPVLAANPRRRRRRTRRRRSYRRRRRNPSRGPIERGVGTITGTLPVLLGGYAGTGLTRAAIKWIPGFSDVLSRIGLDSKQGGGATALLVGVLGTPLLRPLLRMVGMARYTSALQKGLVIFGLKDLLDPFIEEQVYQRVGLGDYLTVPGYGMGDYLRFRPTMGQLPPAAPTSYGVPIPLMSYSGDPFSR